MSQETLSSKPSKIIVFLKSIGVKESIAKAIIGTITNAAITATGITTIVIGAIRTFVQCNTGLLTVILISLGLILLSWGLSYVLISKKKEEEIVSIDAAPPGKPSGKLVPRFTERQRRLALAALITVLLLTVAGFGLWKRLDSRLPDKTIILVANFDGPEAEFDMTGRVIKHLRDWESKYGNDLSVKALQETITFQEGEKKAIEKGNCFKASIVLWGSYRVYQGIPNGSVYFKVLKWKGPEDVTIKPERSIDNAELKGFKIQTDLSSDMSYLALMTIGLARYETLDYSGAIDRFDDALRQPSIPKDNLSPAVAHFFKGLCHSEIAQRDSDQDQLRIAIQEYDKTLNDLSSASGDEQKEKTKRVADFNRVNANVLLRHASAQDARDALKHAVQEYEENANDYVNAGISKWAVMNNWGFALYELGLLQGDDAKDQLYKAVTEYNDAICVCPSERPEQDCALTYNNLGNALYELAGLLSESDRDKCLADADTAYRNALDKGYPNTPDVANNRANVLVLRAGHTPGNVGDGLLREAALNYTRLLEVYKEDSLEYATANYNLGYALLTLSERVGGEEAKEGLRRAEPALRVALDMSCREHQQIFPNCPMAQRDLGKTLYLESKETTGQDKRKLLQEAKQNIGLAAQYFDPTHFADESRKIHELQDAIASDLNSM